MLMEFRLRAHDVPQLLEVVGIGEVWVRAIASRHVFVDAMEIDGERIDEVLAERAVADRSQ